MAETYRVEVQRQDQWQTFGGTTGVYERLTREVAEVRAEYIKRIFRLPCRVVPDQRRKATVRQDEPVWMDDDLPL